MYLDDLVAGAGVLSTEQFSPEVFSVYPNPVKDVLNINSKVAVNKVVVYDILGKTVLQENPETISPTIDMSNLPSGRSEEHTSELQSRPHLVCRLLLEKKKKKS